MEITYTVLGTDGNKYGPVALKQLQSWVIEGRVSSDAQVLRSDLTEWYPASSFQEITVTPAAGSAAPSAAPVTTPTAAAMRPAVGVAASGELVELEKRIKSGASWYYWIAALTLVNSIATFSGTDWGFVLGLMITQIVDHFGQAAGAGIGALVFDVFAVGVFILFGVFAGKRHLWAFIIGMVIYAVDGLLALIGQVWIGVAIHAFALFCLFVGLKAALRFRQVNRAEMV